MPLRPEWDERILVVHPGPGDEETVSKPSTGEKSWYVGWPGGHCLQVPKEHEVPVPGPSPMPNPLPKRERDPDLLVASRPGRITSGPPKQNRRSTGSTILVRLQVLKHLLNRLALSIAPMGLLSGTK